jgi:hypothetical protein
MDGDMTIYVIANGAFTAKVQIAHSGALAADGTSPDAGPAGSSGSLATAPYDQWFDLFYAGATQMQIALAGAGNAALIIPDFSPGWIRLVATVGTAVAVTAGYETAAA